MSSIFYVKKIIVLLKDSDTAAQFQPLKKKLQGEEIDLLIYVVGKTLNREVLQETRECAENALYITDCNHTAVELRERNLPMLGWLHEDGDSLSGAEYVMECPEELDTDYLDRVYRRYRDIPWDILETERCIIRETTVEDVDSFFEIYRHSEITRYTEGLHTDKEQEKAYIQTYIDKVYRYFEFGTWTVIWKETGEIIGRAGLSVREGYELPDLGFVIGVPWQGKGIAYEICSAILQYGKEELGLEQVQALVMPENEVSLKLCGKLGFVEQERRSEKQEIYVLLVKRLT